MPTRLLIVDDQALFREALKTLCALQPDLDVVGVAGDGREAVQLADRLRPDVVLMDVRMPVMDGVEATRLVKAAHPEVHVVVLTTYDDDEYVREALAAGAAGYLLKDSPPPALFAAIAAVQAGGTFISPPVAARLVVAGGHRTAASEASKPARAPYRPADSPLDLTEREWEVLQLIADGLSNREIARRLFLTEGTVKNYISAIYAKIGTNDRVRAAILARELRAGTGEADAS
ncbi:MAG: response regulator transcription factor [Limnochordaceae bacterium]|nr:response regulator transcription factor [Limnochordaceae bacterium]